MIFGLAKLSVHTGVAYTLATCKQPDGYLRGNCCAKKSLPLGGSFLQCWGADLPLEEEKQPRNDLNVPLNHPMLPRGPLT
jgi:hypothetical protein